MVFYDAHTKQGVQSFVARLNSLTLDERRTVAVFALRNGLMQAKGVSVLIFWFVKAMKKYDTFLYVLRRRSPKLIDEAFADLIRHAQHGKDSEDGGRAAGGFSQREVNMLAKYL